MNITRRNRSAGFYHQKAIATKMRIPWCLLIMMYYTCHCRWTTKLAYQHLCPCADFMPRTGMIDYNEAIDDLITVSSYLPVRRSVRGNECREHRFFSSFLSRSLSLSRSHDWFNFPNTGKYIHWLLTETKRETNRF